jgi:hypothetical protein
MASGGNGFGPADVGRAIAGYNAASQRELLDLSPNQVGQLLDGDWRTVGAVRLNQHL